MCEPIRRHATGPTMKRLLLLCSMSLATGTAHAQTVPADLQRLLPQTQKRCFARVYDRNHLAAHPDQLVTSTKLLLQTGLDYAPYTFTIWVTMRGKKDVGTSDGHCW